MLCISYPGSGMKEKTIKNIKIRMRQMLYNAAIDNTCQRGFSGYML